MDTWLVEFQILIIREISKSFTIKSSFNQISNSIYFWKNIVIFSYKQVHCHAFIKDLSLENSIRNEI